MEVGGTPQDQFANNLAQNQALQAEIKKAIIIELMRNNPKLAKAIAHRSTHRQLYASGDGASFYDSNGTYKTELQTYLASIKVEINNLLETLLGTGKLKLLYEKSCYYKSLWNQPEDLFEKDPILCY